jgi:hypothetical protein
MYGEHELPDPIPKRLGQLLHLHRQQPDDPQLGMQIYLEMENINDERIHLQKATRHGWPTVPNWSTIPERIEQLKANIQAIVYGSALFQSPVWNGIPIETLNRLQNNTALDPNDVRYSRVG